MNCTEAYKEHIEYTFNAFCSVVIRYAAINAWRDRDIRRQRESELLPLKTDMSTKIRRTTSNGGLSLPCSSSVLMNSHPPKTE